MLFEWRNPVLPANPVKTKPCEAASLLFLGIKKPPNFRQAAPKNQMKTIFLLVETHGGKKVTSVLKIFLTG
jgi:hypothetical protein